MIGFVFIGENRSLYVVCVGGDDLETCRLFAQRPLAILTLLLYLPHLHILFGGIVSQQVGLLAFNAVPKQILIFLELFFTCETLSHFISERLSKNGDTEWVILNFLKRFVNIKFASTVGASPIAVTAYVDIKSVSVWKLFNKRVQRYF